MGGLILIFYIFKLVKNTNWSDFKISKTDVLLILFAVIVACFSSSVFNITPKWDWEKHFAIVNVLKNEDHLDLNLSGVTAADSTSMALLVSLVKCAKRYHCRLNFVKIPKTIQRLIVLMNLANLLPVKNKQRLQASNRSQQNK